MSAESATESGAPAVEREADGRWPRGVSGNPGGLTKTQLNTLREMREAARSCAPEALKTLLNIMHNRRVSHATRVAAASALLDRGFGKPATPLPSEFADGAPVPKFDPNDLSMLDVARRIAFALAGGMRVLEGARLITPSADDGESE
jgi:hypothetical protein